ncbi:MAG: hypothetical protein CMN76_08170 [Spirochaetaceae bacterium]|nr:hypothetical protein [Spirochaetaceae bacterium]
MRSFIQSIPLLVCATLFLQSGCAISPAAESVEGIESGITVLLDTGSSELPKGTSLRIGNVERKLQGIPVAVITELEPGDHRMEVIVPGFARHQSVVSAFPGTLNLVLVRLLPIKSTEYIYDGTEIKIRDNTMDIKVDPGTFEAMEEGQTIVVHRAHIDVESEMVHAMPGDFSGTNLDGEPVQLESFGAFELTVMANGQKLKIKDGRFIEVAIPYQGTVEPGQTHATMWSFDEATGRWKEEMEAPLVNRDGIYWVEARIPHLSYWNVDAPIEDHAPIIVRRVTDQNGEIVSSPVIEAMGLDYNGTSRVRGYAPGSLCIQVKRDSKVRLSTRTILRDGFMEVSREIQSKGPGTCANLQNAVYVEDLALEPRALGSFLPGLNELPYVEKLELEDGRTLIGMILANDGSTIIFMTRNKVLRIQKSEIRIQTFL